MATDEHLVDIHALFKDTPENQQLLRQRIRELRNEKELESELRTKRLVSVLQLDKLFKGDVEEHFDGFMTGKVKNLNNVCYEEIVRYLWKKHWWTDVWRKEWIGREPDALFHALCTFLKADIAAMTAFAREAPGVYRLWRPSMHVAGEYVEGLLSISRDPHSYVLKAVEKQAFKGKDGAASQEEEFEGYIVRQHPYCVMMARQEESHGGPPRITIIHNVYRRRGLIRCMEGFVTGCYGENDMFAAPVYFERAEETEKELTQKLGIVAKEDVAAAIQCKLAFTIKDNLIRF